MILLSHRRTVLISLIFTIVWPMKYYTNFTTGLLVSHRPRPFDGSAPQQYADSSLRHTKNKRGSLSAASSVLRSNLPAPPDVPNFCSNCGSPNMEIQVPDNDERPRACCSDCQAIVYSNPKIVVAAVVQSSKTGKFLLAQRAIDPRKGYWGIPQGFMEMGETSREAAVREVYEETGVALQNASALNLRAVYNVPGSVQLVYQVMCDIEGEESLDVAETLESLDVGFFSIEELPELCFPTVRWALDHCNSNSNKVQQKTKFYDSLSDSWSEFEDEQ